MSQSDSATWVPLPGQAIGRKLVDCRCREYQCGVRSASATAALSGCSDQGIAGGTVQYGGCRVDSRRQFIQRQLRELPRKVQTGRQRKPK